MFYRLRSRRARPLSFSLSIGMILTASACHLPRAQAQGDTASSQTQKSGLPPEFAAFLAKFQPQPADFNDHTGWTQIFDGKTLDGWNGSSEIWHVADGQIIGESSPDKPSGTTNIFYTRAKPSNFMLKLEVKLEGTGANGGIQYRSRNVPPKPTEIPAGVSDEQRKQLEARIQAQAALTKRNAPWNMTGYQADLDFANMFSGQLYEQDSKRFIITFPGQFVEAHDGTKNLLSTLATPEELKSYIKAGDWNQVEIIAEGHTLIHLINGHLMSITIDNDPQYSAASGLIGLEIEGPGVVKISHRNIWLKELH